MKQEELPGVLAEIAAAAGVAAARALAEHFGGIRIYIPRVHKLRPDHPLVAAVGMDAAARISERFAGEILEVPKADELFAATGPAAGFAPMNWRCWRRMIHERNTMILREALAGASQAVLARKYRLTERQIRNILVSHPAAPTLDLWEEDGAESVPPESSRP